MLLKSGLKSKSRQKINLATVIFIAVAYASLAELVDAHSIESVEKSIEVRILELALQSSVIVCIRFINSIEGELLIANATVKQVLLFLFVNIYNYKYTDIMERIIKIKIGDCKNRLEPIKVFNQHATAGISNFGYTLMMSKLQAGEEITLTVDSETAINKLQHLGLNVEPL